MGRLYQPEKLKNILNTFKSPKMYVVLVIFQSCLVDRISFGQADFGPRALTFTPALEEILPPSTLSLSDPDERFPFIKKREQPFD